MVRHQKFCGATAGLLPRRTATWRPRHGKEQTLPGGGSSFKCKGCSKFWLHWLQQAFVTDTYTNLLRRDAGPHGHIRCFSGNNGAEAPTDGLARHFRWQPLRCTNVAAVRESNVIAPASAANLGEMAEPLGLLAMQCPHAGWRFA